MCYKKFLHLSIFLIVSVFPLFGSAQDRDGTGENYPSRFDGVYIGVDGAFASSKSEGIVGPVAVRVSIPGSPAFSMSAGPFSFGGKDNIPGGAIFAGYGKTFGNLFIAGEIAGGYGSYDNTKAFTSSNFNSDIDVNQGYLGTTARIGFLINPNLLAYYHVGWAHNWIEAKGTVKTLSFSLPNPSGAGPPVPASASLNQSVKSDLTFDGLSFGIGFEYALADLTGVEGIRFRFGYSRIDYAKEKFHYNANGLAGTELKEISVGGRSFPDNSISIQSNSIPAEADSGVHVLFAGLSYRFRI